MMGRQVIVWAIVCLALAAALPAQAQASRTDIMLGTVTQLDWRADRFQVRDRETGREVWVYTSRSTDIFRRDGRRGSTGDLTRQQDVRVEGTRRSNDRFDAARVWVIPPTFARRYAPPPPGRTNVITGVVSRLNSRERELTVDIQPRGSVLVAVPRSAIIRRANTVLDIERLRAGDRVRVQLDRVIDTARPPVLVTARTVQVLVPGEYPGTTLPYPRGSFEGTVTDISERDEVLIVRVSGGSYAVVTSDAQLTSDGRRIDLRDFRAGDRVRVEPGPQSRRLYEGAYGGYTVVNARRIALLSRGAGEESDVGIVRDIDRDRSRFRLDERLVIVDRNTTFYQGGRRVSFADLRNGDRAEVRGELRDSTLYADRVDILTEGGGSTIDRGVVRDIDRDRSRFRLDERLVIVDRNTTFYRDGRRVSFADLRNDDRADVRGELRDSTLYADRVDILTGEEEGTLDRGIVRDIDRDRSRFRLDERLVIVDRNTTFYQDDRRVSFADLRNGDRAEVRGELRNGTLYANRVDILREGREEVTVRGTIADLDRDARAFRLRAADRDYDVYVEDGAVMTRGNDRIGLGELRNGDRVEVRGEETDRGVINATRIIAL